MKFAIRKYESSLKGERVSEVKEVEELETEDSDFETLIRNKSMTLAKESENNKIIAEKLGKSTYTKFILTVKTKTDES